MRKQLAKVGAVTVAAMMVGTTAFAANLGVDDIKVVYTGLNTVTVSVPVASTSDNATILSVVNGTLLDSIGNDNANDKIVYIDQDGVSASTANLRIADAAGEVEFTFNTERAGVAETDGKIDIFAAGSTYGVNAAAASIYKNAPVKSIALVATGSDAITLTGTTPEKIKEGLTGKAKIVLTHDTTAASDVTTEIAVADASADFAFAVADNKAGVTYTPGANAKYGVKDNAANITTEAAGQLPVTVDVPRVLEDITLSTTTTADHPKMLSSSTEATEAGIVAAMKASTGIVSAVYNYGSAGTESKDVTAQCEYTVNMTAAEGVYTVTASYTDASATGITINPTTVYVKIREASATTAITGTVKTRMALTETTGTAVAGAVVTAFDSTGAFAGAAVTDEAGAYTLEVEDGTYTLVASYQGIEIADGNIAFITTYASVAVGDVVVSGGAEVDEIILTMSIGDANGDGVTDDLDYQDVLSFYGGEYK